METPDLTSDSFWQGSGIHVALPPNAAPPSASLIEVATPHLPEGGCLFQTSGTTGQPKWVVLEKRAFLHSARVVNAHYDFTNSDHWLLALPIHHVGGFAIFARACLSNSKVTMLRKSWNCESFVKTLHDHSISVTSLVPSQLHDLVALNCPSPSSLRVVLVGGGRLDPALMRSAITLGWNVCATYGMTEAASQIAGQSPEHNRFDEPDVLEVLPHWDVETSASGTLIIRGPSLAKGYITVTDSTPLWEPISATAGLATRDVVRLWQHGTRTFLKFLGRSHSFIKVLGELVHLDTLEKYFRNFSGSDFPPFSLVPLPDPRREHRIALAIESLSNPPGFQGTLDAFNQSRPGFERIDSWHLIPHFPRTSLGKLATNELQQRVIQLVNRTAP
jgi:O-succinylbenzoic acid--CoA ligase